jgi:hypothetical protein
MSPLSDKTRKIYFESRRLLARLSLRANGFITRLRAHMGSWAQIVRVHFGSIY